MRGQNRGTRSDTPPAGQNVPLPFTGMDTESPDNDLAKVREWNNNRAGRGARTDLQPKNPAAR